jgi:predicted Zn-dependent peptidase
MFQGSRNVGDDKHFHMLQNAGASSINGTTDYDRTNYFETLPSNQLKLGLWLESDRMGFLLDALTQDKLDNQREVVKNERRQSVENVPYGPSSEKLVQTLFPADHPYYGMVIGSMSDLTAASLDDVKAFFRAYYAPSNATLVLAGDFHPTSAVAWVEQYFANIQTQPIPPRPATPPVVIDGERRARLSEPVPLAQVTMAWLSAPFFAPGDAEADMLAYILGRGRSSRLYQRLVYERQLAQEVSVFQESLALQSIFRATVRGRPGVSVEILEQELQAVLTEIADHPLTSTETERARNTLTTQGLDDLEDVGRRANRLNVYNHYVGTSDYLQQDLARYRAVTAEDLTEFARDLLQPGRRVVVSTVPDGVTS